jgi:hypothetical protein
MFLVLTQILTNCHVEYFDYDYQFLDENFRLHSFDAQFNLALVLNQSKETKMSSLTLQLATDHAHTDRHSLLLKRAETFGLDVFLLYSGL